MSLKKRFDSLLIRTALASEARGMGFNESGGGGVHESTPPPGVGLLMDRDRVEAALTRAITTAEEILDVQWDSELGHVARRRQPFDPATYQVSILRDYAGTSTRVVAAETGEKPHVIRDMRRRHGFDGDGWRTRDPECGPVCPICERVLSDLSEAA